MYIHTDYLGDNVMTRSLSNKGKDDILTNIDLAKAKEILKRKVLVGLYDRMNESIDRFESFFGYRVGNDAHACQEAEVGLTSEKQKVEVPTNENSPALTALMRKNMMDMELFQYARFLYDYQGHAIFGIVVAATGL